MAMLRGQLRRSRAVHQEAARRRRGGEAEALVPPSFAPGDAYPFDWPQNAVLINGMT
jgi:hypothetical protein